MNDQPGLHILLLDDEPFMLKLLGRMLARQGCANITLAEGGAAGLAVVHGDSPPDLILCDLNMPEMDGIEFIRRLVEHNYRGSLILVSGEDSRMLQAASQLALAHGLRLLGHLAKPVLPDQLAQLLDKWCDARWRSLSLSAASGAGGASQPAPYTKEELAAALRDGQLMNYYQPKVSIASGRMVGVEALVRWQHPRDGIVYPDNFIPLAEESGLIDQLTRVVFSSAMKHARTWHEGGLDLSMSVNVSMDNLHSLGFVDFIVAEAAAAEVAPRKIILEVTESRLMQDLRTPLEVLARLRLRRFRLSVDDFGTGYSSLVQLRDIPFDELKIDRSFVHGAGEDPTKRAICSASIGLARQMGLDAVAEGVEDSADWRFLQAIGCDLAQGYFIARPMPADAVLAWAAHWQATCSHELERLS
ncbi:EAL domain-containing response regulator [Duganella aceris]|uniref:EAL domain-containing response regulator n=1 Tax=Duganella aceris TaxID=2703883 RepID=A0ABX0FPA4_9BURK|nr:EAL domain-containing response regulator [Duganella aceris]NGZ86312.1 EAL domain-containing response regulator [Duganella aceris]